MAVLIEKLLQKRIIFIINCYAFFMDGVRGYLELLYKFHIVYLGEDFVQLVDSLIILFR